MDNYNILHELDRTARSVRPNQPFFTQAEYVPETSDIVKANNGPLDACWSSTFHGIISEALINQNKFELDVLKYAISAPNLVNYLACHDNERLMYLVGQLDQPFQRVRLGTIVLMTSVSVPLIWQGDEFGEARQLGNDNQHRKKLTMQWLLMEKEENKNLFDIFKRLIEFRHRILNNNRYNKINFCHENFDYRILVYTRSSDVNNEDIVIITNFGDQIRNDYEIKNFPHNGKWIDWLTNDIYSVNNSILKLDLKPFDGKILLRQK